MRLGEALIQRGHITEAQLEKALNAQLIHGGHLGTCMIELGYVDEETLGELLSEVHNVRYARPELLVDVSAQVLSSLGQESVERRLAVPFDLVKRTLHVAMVNPRHVPSLDELGLVSGCRIEAWVSPEVRIFQAMERYYFVPRRVRYITLARSLDEKQMIRLPVKPKKAVAAVMQAGVAAPAQAPPSLVPLAPLHDFAEPCSTGEPRAGRRPSPCLDDLQAVLSQMAEELSRAEDVGPAIRTVLSFVSAGAARCVMFGVREGEAFVRDVRGFTLDAISAYKIRFAVTQEPLLTLLSGESYYRGPVPDEPRFSGFFEALRSKRPQEILLLPAYRHERLAALLYADGGVESRIEGETQGFVRAMRMFTLSLDLIDIRQKIRSA